ncbi:MAG: chitobiase/beta-hexosaminidase C-terminal domain-containing protein [Deltaproteobacteria bacterium]|nr:MAG: chitobiase/beta-hexosaminidase C-terminal domain-containing protein [Deltaproteobacteria bacterium]
MRKEKRTIIFQLVFLYLTYIFVAAGCGKEISSTLPDTSITSGPSDPTNQTSATFWFIATRPFCTFECQMDRGGYTSCTSPKTYDGLLDGRHTFEVRATHRAGKTDPTPVRYTWTIDTTPPNLLMAFPAGGSYCPITVSLTASDGIIYYTLDGSEPTPESTEHTDPIDINGDTTLKFMAVDACGNQSATATEVYEIDTGAVVNITSPMDEVPIGTGNVRVAGNADTNISTVSLDATQGTWTDTNPVVSEGTWSSTLQAPAAGAVVTITVTGVDACGNTGTDSVKVFVPPYIWYVNDDATGGETGLSWENAFTVIQDAANVSVTGDMIWVAEGTYTNSPTSTASVLTMKAGVEIYGGFTGTELDLSERGDLATHPTILDGEDKSYHVVVGASSARLDGFIMTGGRGYFDITWEGFGGGMHNKSVTDLTVANCTFRDNFVYQRGGGMYNHESSPSIIDCAFVGNSARNGGGMFNRWLSSPTITNCTFSGNSASEYGGGMHNNNIASPSIINSTFIGNSAGWGGGMYNTASSPEIINCTFNDNVAYSNGGGICNHNAYSPKITNCILIGNSADFHGGGMYNWDSSPEIANCTFVGNLSNDGGGISSGFISSLTITNCIFWGNTNPPGSGIALWVWMGSGATLTISYSDVQGGQDAIYVDPGCTLNWGDGMIEDDPLFVSGPDGDYYLSHTAAGEPFDSLCIDAGSDTAENLSLDDRTTRTDRVTDSGIVDMGYHYEPPVPPGYVVASPPGGVYCFPGLSVTLSCYDPDATIYYTLDGSGPTTASPVYAGPINISEDTTLKAIAEDQWGNLSEIITEVYDIDTEVTVSITYPVDGVTNAGDVMVTGTADTDITTVTVTSDQGHIESSDVIDGDWSVILTGVILSSITINATGMDNCGNIGSDLVTVPIIPPTCNIISVGSTTGCPGDSITISGNSFGATEGILSFDGIGTTVTSWNDTSIVISAPGGNYTIVTVTLAVGGSCSLAGTYFYDNLLPNDLVASPAGGSYCPTSVTVTLSASEGTIYYTIDGSGPTTGSPVYTGPIDISGDTILKFMAVDTCGNQAATVTEVYDIDTETPTGLVASPTGGSYCATPVTLSASEGTIYYTIDGSGPTTGSSVYTGPIDISGDTILKFMAVDVCGYQAATVTEVYDIDTEVVVTITSPLDSATTYAGDIWVAGTADTDIATVTVASDQGHSESSRVNAGGNWSVVLTGVTLPSIVITTEVMDNCGNAGSDSVTVSVSEPTIWYVDADATGNNDGTSWADAFTVIQDAVGAASTDNWIWVAEGTYTNTPTSTVSVLTMKAGVEIYGGFTGTESALSERGDPTAYPTILDGENTSYHVVLGASNTHLDGFTITGGNANGIWPNNSGGGMYNDSMTNLVVANCTFIGNQANFGGGMFNQDSSPLITNCTFNGNSAGRGGGMYNYDNSSPTITNCTFVGNSAYNEGGGMYNNGGSPTITNCIMWGDIAPNGPEIYNSPSTPIVTYSDIEGSYTGTGNIEADPQFVNVPDLLDITTADGATTTIEVADATLYAVNDIIEIEDDGMARTVSSASGTTVTFSPALTSNSTIRMIVENWGLSATDLDEDFHLQFGSPCIDAGNGDVAPEYDMEGNLRCDDPDTEPNTGTGNPPYTDMGPYEYQCP